MVMNERRREIIFSVIEAYLETGRPVGSKAVQERHLPGISSATIRNEMTVLEEEGWLRQPHTSAGRVPTEQAWELYVKQLRPQGGLSREEEGLVEARLSPKDDMEAYLQAMVKVLADLTETASFVCLHSSVPLYLHHVDLVPIGDDLMILLITHLGGVYKRRVPRPRELDAQTLRLVVAFLNRCLQGTSLDQLQQLSVSDLPLRGAQATGASEPFFARLFDEAREMAEVNRMYVEGASFLARFREFRDADVLRAILALLEDEEKMLQILSALHRHEVACDLDSPAVVVHFGLDQDDGVLSQCSVVMSCVHMGDKNLAVMGVIGPHRLDYRKVMSSVAFLSRKFSQKVFALH